jgi:flagellar motor protein MotB
MSGETNIDDLMNNMGSLSNDENTMVDSIINDLNSGGGGGGGGPPMSSQSQMPQISEDEKKLLIQQQQQEQQMLQQQMLQQQQQQQQQQFDQQQQMQQQPQMLAQTVQITPSFNYLNYIHENKDGIILFFILLLLNFEAVDELLKFKDFSLFYSFDTGRSTYLSMIFKCVITSVLFLVIKYLIP